MHAWRFVFVLAGLGIGDVASLKAVPPPRDAFTVDAPEPPADYRLHVALGGTGSVRVLLGSTFAVQLTNGLFHDIAVERPAQGSPVVRVWRDGKLVRGPEEASLLAAAGSQEFPAGTVNFGRDFTAMARFVTKGSGTLFAKCPSTGKWAPDAKAFFVRGGVLVFDIGWLGAVSGGARVDDGRVHTAIVVSRDGDVSLWLDGQVVARKEKFARPDDAGHVLKLGRAAPNFGGDFVGERIATVQIWGRALPEAELRLLFQESLVGASTPDFSHASSEGDGRPVLEPAPGTKVESAWLQALERSDHAAIIAGWNEKTLEAGREIYATLCVVCHGTRDQPGSLPTARRFATEELKNGADPYSMYLTLTRGYGQMVPQGQYTTAQKYSVIQYIRETFLRPARSRQWTELTPEYLASLPKALTRAPVEVADQTPPPYQQMDFGPAMFFTFQVAPGNIAQKGIAIRLDAGPGGVSKGRAWMVYEHDTMRVAAATTGRFLDWKSIAFDGSHGTHPGLGGDRHFVNPDAPGWANAEGRWDDRRLVGRDGRRYGPLPREWMRLEGVYLHEGRVILAARIHGVRVLELPGWIDYGATPVFTRTLNIGAPLPDATSGGPGFGAKTGSRWPGALKMRVAPETLNVVLDGDGRLSREDGYWVVTFTAPGRARVAISRTDPASLAALTKAAPGAADLDGLIHGGKAQWAQEVVTYSEAGPGDSAFVADTFPLPLENPWNSWMRPGGFDFTPDGQSAVLATWNGDVWRVDGLLAAAPAPLRWRRIAAGLFQPLGVKFRGDELFVTCRDQLVRLRDLNGDGEIDYLEDFNSDHQVTEHFHEFAMGLQTDAAGNFYYAKSGRHALDAVVPHHGTLLRVSADGSRTDILATGFRAANGVCVNDDGTFFVTDQEGFWTPKNRINRVKPGRFYGNMFGYTSVTNSADDAMEPPMVWITNDKDRSPAELVRIPADTWGVLGGALLNLSYGTGRAFAVPHEEVGGRWQGAVCELPMPAFPTGIMRGRFSPDGALYTCGMFAWAGNATSPGGFYRIRRGSKPAWVPLAVHARRGAFTVTLSDPVDAGSVTPEAFRFKVWHLQRTANYGSRHYDEHPLAIAGARLEADGRTIRLDLPNLAPTQCYELVVKIRGRDGTAIERSLHGTILELGPAL